MTLPTEAQWKYVADGGIYHEQEAEADYLFWHKQNSDGKSHGVETSGENVLSVYGMFGNVAEMCLDTYNERSYQNHVCKGGSWDTPMADCNGKSRRSIDMNEQYKDVGFRIVINL